MNLPTTGLLLRLVEFHVSTSWEIGLWRVPNLAWMGPFYQGRACLPTTTTDQIDHHSQGYVQINQIGGAENDGRSIRCDDLKSKTRRLATIRKMDKNEKRLTLA